LNSKISDKDKKDWENFLSNNENLPNKDSHNLEKKTRGTNIFDLHGYTLDEANVKINNLIHHAYNNEIKKLIIVTGKGLHSENEKDPYVSKDLGILKYSVPEFIKSNSELMNMINEIKDAELADGGKGAFYIFLKKKL
jgi:DNA-nicking Smr family endonuclease